MTCEKARPLLDAYLDAELDLGASLAVEEHLAACAHCPGVYRRLELLRSEIAAAELERVPEEIVDRARARVRASRRSWRVSPRLLLAAAAVVILAVLVPWRLTTGSAGIEEQMVDYHIRSLLDGHLIDVASSDRHTVKPWFQGKVEFAPPVIDLTASGFTLAGGRLDVIASRRVAALVYMRRGHVINLWVFPEQRTMDQSRPRDVNGYHLVAWSREGLAYRAVSDLNEAELQAFARAFRAN